MEYVPTPYDFMLTQTAEDTEDMLLLSCWRCKDEEQLWFNLEMLFADHGLVGIPVGALVSYGHVDTELQESLTIVPNDKTVTFIAKWGVDSLEETEYAITIPRKGFEEMVETLAHKELTYLRCKESFKKPKKTWTIARMFSNIFNLPNGILELLTK